MIAEPEKTLLTGHPGQVTGQDTQARTGQLGQDRTPRSGQDTQVRTRHLAGQIV
jgi:hypothetical protein